jgi:hypothetical protein
LLSVVPGNGGSASGFPAKEELYLFSVKLGKDYGQDATEEDLQSLTNEEEPHKLHTFYSERKKCGDSFPARPDSPCRLNIQRSSRSLEDAWDRHATI